MRPSYAEVAADFLADAHQADRGSPPAAHLVAGYGKIGKQFERFLLQAKTFKNEERCRQILCANIPKICRDYGIDLEWVYSALETMCRGLDFASGVREIEPYFSAVLEDHRANPRPMSANMTGCVIPLVIVFTAPAVLIVIRTLG